MLRLTPPGSSSRRADEVTLLGSVCDAGGRRPGRDPRARLRRPLLPAVVSARLSSASRADDAAPFSRTARRDAIVDMLYDAAAPRPPRAAAARARGRARRLLLCGATAAWRAGGGANRGDDGRPRFRALPRRRMVERVPVVRPSRHAPAPPPASRNKRPTLGCAYNVLAASLARGAARPGSTTSPRGATLMLVRRTLAECSHEPQSTAYSSSPGLARCGGWSLRQLAWRCGLELRGGGAENPRSCAVVIPQGAIKVARPGCNASSVNAAATHHHPCCPV